MKEGYLIIFSCTLLASTAYLTLLDLVDWLLVTIVPSFCTTVRVLELPALLVVASAVPLAVTCRFPRWICAFSEWCNVVSIHFDRSLSLPRLLVIVFVVVVVVVVGLRSVQAVPFVVLLCFVVLVVVVVS